MDFSIEILKIIEGALKQDKNKVISYTSFLINKLEQNGETRIANSLKKTLNSKNVTSIKQMSAGDVFRVPIDKESRLPMADIIYPNEVADEIVLLNDRAREEVERFLEYYKNVDKLLRNGINTPNSILLFGPPGCGKTKLAKLMSFKTGLPIVVSRLDGLISSFLGSTSKNIRAIFDFAQNTPCILFLDEFDAIAKIRDDNHELGELKRVVNSLLQNIDALKSGSIIIAATNHEQLLDSAVWRRFGFKIKIDMPEYKIRKELVKLFLKQAPIADNQLDLLSKMFRGLSGAGIEEICKKSLIDFIINVADIDITNISKHYFDYINILSERDNDKLNEKQAWKIKAKYLRDIDNKAFSYSQIAIIFNKSKSYVSNLFKKDKEINNGQGL
jgi:SpoVK/Ycf46/Vps4 family AAA+-type ATPase